MTDVDHNVRVENVSDEIAVEEHDEPQCTCPPLSDIARAGAEEKPVPPCSIHRPETGYQNSNVPLNGTALTALLRRELGSGVTVNLAEEMRQYLVVADKPKPPPTIRTPNTDVTI